MNRKLNCRLEDLNRCSYAQVHKIEWTGESRGLESFECEVSLSASLILPKSTRTHAKPGKTMYRAPPQPITASATTDLPTALHSTTKLHH
jgi:hypothetical protein